MSGVTIERAIELPDAWVTEDNVLFITGRLHWNITGDLMRAANDQMEQWNYPIRFTRKSLVNAYVPVWVDPSYIEHERWPKGACSTEPVGGWVKLFRVDLENLPADVEIGRQDHA